MAVGMPHLLQTGQIGDGRERALSAYVTQNARRGDLDDVIRAIDEFARNRSFLINIGDEKGLILDKAVARAQPKLLLELGTYCGYSALRTVRAMPAGAHLYTIEPNSANAAIARQIWEHAGVAHRITAVVGMLGDSGGTIARLRNEYGFGGGALDFVFVDHLKSAYLPDLRRIMAEDWLHEGSVVVADNVKTPGAPDYLAYMRANETTLWSTVEHDTHAEYQKVLKDLVLESTYLGSA
ncbi:O-methyltransferase [Antrihabitans sp. YC2-6]|uniref:O-methyltransferase n=1 Tax=Antrihabitans sp. YC2-6 TaxID=2799498 RepID=UPI001F2665D5|nr:O-methyltransferase [Antrihabitans sp. YC2-6]